MVWRIGFYASLFAIILVLTTSRSALSEPARKPTRITSYQENIRLGNLTFSTAGQAIVAPPRIRYLRGAKGETLLMVDFANILYPFPPQQIRALNESAALTSTHEAPIEIINFGQFQASPPIFRIVASARQADVLKGISFATHSGKLVMSWPNNIEVSSRAPLTFKPPTKANATERIAAEPASQLIDSATNENNNEQLQLVFSTSKFDQETNKEVVSSNRSSSLPSMGPAPPKVSIPSTLPLESFDRNPQDSSEGKAMTVQSEVPKIEIDSQRNLSDLPDQEAPLDIARVRITGKQKLVASAFRLHEPERYVVDFQNLPLLSDTELPTPQKGTPFTAMRVGTPDGKPTISRLVFDLASKDCSVHSELINSACQLVLTFNSSGNASVTTTLPAGMQVVLDPGHGGSDPGARRNGIQEKELTLSIVNALKQRLEDRGIKVVLTRSNDSFVSLEDRVKLTNSIAPNLFLSVHINSLEADSDIHGIETYYQTTQSKPFADTIHDCLVNNLEVPDRYVRKARFYVVNHTYVPAVLAEVGFISCKEERERLISFDYQDRIAKALEQGVILYLVKQNQLAQAGPAAANQEEQVRRSY